MKKLLCPHCKKDLKELGFRTEETIYTTFNWQWKKKEGYFVNDSEEVDNSEVDEILCNNCDEDIRNFVIENGLL